MGYEGFDCIFISLPTKHLPVPAVPSMHIADNVHFGSRKRSNVAHLLNMEMLASKRGWPAVAALGRALWLKYRTQKISRIQITALRSNGSLKVTIV